MSAHGKSGGEFWLAPFYGALIAFAIVGLYAFWGFIDGTLRWPAGWRSELELAGNVLVAFGALLSTLGAVGGALLGLVVRLLRRWPVVARIAGMLSGATLAGIAGVFGFFAGLAFNPEWIYSGVDIVLLVAVPALGGALLGWLLSRKDMLNRL